jgi:hypothetical protein
MAVSLAAVGASHCVQCPVTPSKAPHFVQKRRSPGFGPASLRRAPQFLQKTAESLSAAPHCVQMLFTGIPLFDTAADLDHRARKNPSA